MGCKILGAGKGEISYTTRGDVKAYVQFQQGVPPGMHRLAHWPAEIFGSMLPPAPPPAPLRDQLRVEAPDLGPVCEAAPLLWQKQPAVLLCIRPPSGGQARDYYLKLTDPTGAELARFAEGYGLACAFVHQDMFHAFASRFEDGTWHDFRT
jgi:hypothetical protein